MSTDKSHADARTGWTDDDSESVRLVIDGLARIESGVTEMADARLLAKPPSRKMTIKDAKEIAAVCLPALRGLRLKMDGQPIAASPVEQSAAAPIELSGVKETLETGDGFWRSCSGCHETCDGHPVGEYPYSAILKCDLGAGCSECGGIGAVWDNTDYTAMGDAFERTGLLNGCDAPAPADERAAWRSNVELAIGAWGLAIKHGDRNVIELAAKVEALLDRASFEFKTASTKPAPAPKQTIKIADVMLTAAAKRYDELMGSLQGCTDDGCAIRTPTGMHTNGGCRCYRDGMKMQRMAYAAKELRKAVEPYVTGAISPSAEG